MPAADGDRFYFCHIPKTAGTSFREALWEQFPGPQSFPSRADLKVSRSYREWKSLARDTELAKDDIRLLCGHYPLGAGRRFFAASDQLRWLTFLRPGTDRAVSHFRHMQRHQPDQVDQELDRLKRGAGAFANLQTRRLSAARGVLGEAELKRAKRVLSRADLVGLSEDFAGSVALANELFGWSLGHARANVAPPEQPRPSEEILELFGAANQLDDQLYAHARALPYWVGYRAGAAAARTSPS